MLRLLNIPDTHFYIQNLSLKHATSLPFQTLKACRPYKPRRPHSLLILHVFRVTLLTNDKGLRQYLKKLMARQLNEPLLSILFRYLFSSLRIDSGKTTWLKIVYVSLFLGPAKSVVSNWSIVTYFYFSCWLFILFLAALVWRNFLSHFTW